MQKVNSGSSKIFGTRWVRKIMIVVGQQEAFIKAMIWDSPNKKYMQQVNSGSSKIFSTRWVRKIMNRFRKKNMEDPGEVDAIWKFVLSG